MRRLLVCLPLLVAATAASAETIAPPGSALALDPPDGFMLSTAFAGFEDRSRGASVVLVELPPEAFAAMQAGLSDEALAGKAIHLTGRERFATGLGDGLLLTATQEEMGMQVSKWMLLVPGPGFTGLVTVTAPPHEADAGAPAPLADAEVRAALASVTAVTRSDPAAALPFTFEETQNLRLARTLAGSSAMFTGDGRPAAPGNAPILIVAASVGDVPVPAQRHALATSLLHSVSGFGDLVVDEAQDVPLGEGVAVALQAHGTDQRSGQPMALAQWLIVGTGGYVRVLGIASPQQMTTVLPEFTQLAGSIRLR